MTDSSRSSSGAPNAETKTRLLDAAEDLFAEKGFSRTSLRDLTGAAKANLAAVHYHFGSKDDLLRSVMARRLVPLNRERLDRLRAVLETLTDDERPPLDQLLKTMLEPVLRLGHEPGGEKFMRLLGRLHAEPQRSPVREMFFEQFREVASHFFPAFARALPHLSPADLHWRLHFMIGSMAHTMMSGQGITHMSGGLCDASDIDETLRQMVAYAHAGLTALPTAELNLPATNTPADDSPRSHA